MAEVPRHVVCLLPADRLLRCLSHGTQVAPGAHYLAVFRVAGTAAFLTFALGPLVNSIWKGQPWSVALKEAFDGFIYSLLLAGTFGWLWPR